MDINNITLNICHTAKPCSFLMHTNAHTHTHTHIHTCTHAHKHARPRPHTNTPGRLHAWAHYTQLTTLTQIIKLGAEKHQKENKAGPLLRKRRYIYALKQRLSGWIQCRVQMKKPNILQQAGDFTCWLGRTEKLVLHPVTNRDLNHGSSFTGSPSQRAYPWAAVSI